MAKRQILLEGKNIKYIQFIQFIQFKNSYMFYILHYIILYYSEEGRSDL